MNKLRRHLLTLFAIPTGCAILLAVIFETDLLPCGICADDKGLEFVAATIMELLTICIIPIAMKLLKLKCVERRMTTLRGVQRFSTYRCLMLTLPLLVNTLLYYMFMNVAFGYMAIILLLSLAFVWPTRQRCHDEAAAASDNAQ